MNLWAARNRITSVALARVLGESIPVPIAKYVAPTASPNEVDLMRIPKRVWSTWKTNLLAPTHASGLNEFRDLNPDFEFNLYTDGDCDDFVRNEFGHHAIADFYFRARVGPLRSDIWRYLILYKHGGWYFDIKSRFTTSLSSVTDLSASCVYARESPGFQARNVSSDLMDLVPSAASPSIVNWAVAFSSGHPILEELLDEICRSLGRIGTRVSACPREDIITTSGPVALGRVLSRHTGARSGASLVRKPDNFHPYGQYEMKRSWTRWIQVPHYALESNVALLE